MSTPQRAVVWLLLQRGGRRAVEVGIDPAEAGPGAGQVAAAAGQRPAAGGQRLPRPRRRRPPNPVFGLPDLGGDPVGALAGHLADQHGIGGDTTSWLADHEGLVGLVGEHDLDHTEHPDPQLDHTHPSTW